MIKVYLFLAFVSVLLGACTSQSTEKTWVYLELAIDNKDTTDEFIYGQIDSYAEKALQSKKSSNLLFTVENIRYISLQDSLEVEEDDVRSGIGTYNTLNVRHVEYLKKDPLFIDEGIPLSQRSLKIRDGLRGQTP